MHESKTRLDNSNIYFIYKNTIYNVSYNWLFLHCTSVQSISAGMFSLVCTIGLIYNAMSNSKSSVPSMVSCSLVYHTETECALKTLLSDALSPLATKMRRLISQQQFYVHLI